MTEAIHPAPTEFSDDQLSTDPILRYFHYSHLPRQLQDVSSVFCHLAAFIVETLPRNAERTVALRKLLEAKDAGVRANVGAVTRKPETFLDRLKAEQKQLAERLEKLETFIACPAFQDLPSEQRSLLSLQAGSMTTYLDILDRRILALDYSHVALDEIKTTGGGSEETPIPFGG